MKSVQELLQTLIGPVSEHSEAGSGQPRRAFLWARVSTDKQEKSGLSIPEQLRQCREFAEARGFQVAGEFREAASAFRHHERRHEFQKMLGMIDAAGATAIIVHDYSRFGRESHTAMAIRRDLEKRGVQVLSVTDPVVDSNTAAGVYMDHITYAKNEAYSREVAFHTRKGCTANVQARDPRTGWCYKNGGQPLFGYRAERLICGELKRGVPRIKVIWVPDEMIVAGRTIDEWARHCLVELAGRGASLDELVAFCHKAGIPGRRKKFWGTSTWYALLQPSVLMQYCGYGVWNVRDKQGRERPPSDWVIVENAHPALISEAQAIQIMEARRANGKKGLASRSSRARASEYLLSGGLFKCARCGQNMIGFHTQSGYYYVCGSQPYRKGMGCGPGVYVPQKQVEAQVLSGVASVLGGCSDPKGFTSKVNAELRRLWEDSTGYRPDAVAQIAAVDRKIANIRQAVEDGLGDAAWANARLATLCRERTELAAALGRTGAPPKIETRAAMEYRRNLDKLFRQGEPAERKRFLRDCVQEVRLIPETLEVAIRYRLPETVMNGVVAGGGFEPPTFGL